MAASLRRVDNADVVQDSKFAVIALTGESLDCVLGIAERLSSAGYVHISFGCQTLHNKGQIWKKIVSLTSVCEGWHK
ncbi:hypothetical protein Plhal304r1_c002g0006861 [Plasmopara halstedii]